MNQQRIVFVEDKGDDVETTEALLKRSGLECHLRTVNDRRSFEANLRDEPPAAILCDLSTAGLPGPAALDIAKRVAPQIPLIFFFGAKQYASRTFDRSMKPTHNLTRLVGLLKRAFEDSKASRATPVEVLQ